jgi:hypothetical protein
MCGTCVSSRERADGSRVATGAGPGGYPERALERVGRNKGDRETRCPRRVPAGQHAGLERGSEEARSVADAMVSSVVHSVMTNCHFCVCACVCVCVFVRERNASVCGLCAPIWGVRR